MRLFTKSNVATIAIVTGIVVASGTGGAVAGALITGKQIKDGTVTSIDIANGSLTGTDIKNATVGRGDLATSARGVQAPKVILASAPVIGGSWNTAPASCPSGYRVLAATGWMTNSRGAVQLDTSNTGVTAYSPDVDSSDTVNLRLVCAIFP
ncbi:MULTISPECIES: hypothetical protein [unclassified Nocardioides]|jgi:hypothetical protein|uniref:hypothetical protein n=1 Tax=unclassified Nocardioides TaxID=2615069 RepID=UPI0007025FA1|nr:MULTISPECIES: hypothetical protein [unclassified Nocardioides]KRC57400.1 hypothetical protein ASE19_24065 [Nocardioides sp. Root79]KRC74246.1 hypothetical protein ASE20_24025 [Nocardioides sp. Root240]